MTYAPAPEGDFLDIRVDNMGFFLEKLHEDCGPLQFLRELTQNSIESIQKLDEPGGTILWDVDWPRYELENIFKLSITDNGTGMTGEEMVQYINHLAASTQRQGIDGNYGVGAKIAAAPLNPEGLVYISWKDGQGYMIQLHKDEQKGNYGLARFDSGEFWQRISDDLKPEIIDQHGTKVILLGKSKEDNTMQAPPKSPNPKGWIVRYLDSRYFKIPEGIELKTRMGWEIPRENTKHNYRLNIKGYGVWLNDNHQAKGTIFLEETNATAHWWIIKEGTDLDSGMRMPPGHVAALHKNEIYEAPNRKNFKKLQSFGVLFGVDRVVIYIEPNDKVISTDTARIRLRINQDDLDWDAYAKEFRDNMPQEIQDYQNNILSQEDNAEDRQKAIANRLKSIEDLFKFGRFRAKPKGKYFIDGNQKSPLGNQAVSKKAFTLKDDSNDDEEVKSHTKKPRKKEPDIYALFPTVDGLEADILKNDNPEPKVTWITVENGTRKEGDMEKSAARYWGKGQHNLLINADFFVFKEMEARWLEKYSNIPESEKEIIKEVVQEWFQQQLVEVIMSAHALKQSEKWAKQEIDELWSEDALTAAILPRYHIDINIKRSLGQRIRSLNIAS